MSLYSVTCSLIFFLLVYKILHTKISYRYFFLIFFFSNKTTFTIKDTKFNNICTEYQQLMI